MKCKWVVEVLLVGTMATSLFSGCSMKTQARNTKTKIEIIQYKPEAAAYFAKVEKEFNATHKDIELVIESPNDAQTVMRTRFIREDYPDMIGIGGDINFSYYMDAKILADISDYSGLKKIKPAYLQMDDRLKFIPSKGCYAVPYAANAAGILYNKKIFAEHGWSIPTTWDELITLCKKMKEAGVQPLYFGFKDTWTTMAPWNALAVTLSSADTCRKVNENKTTFSKEYKETAEKMKELLTYGEKNAFAYSYNDACTAFANGESAMFTIGSYAVPQILSVNPKMKIDSFVFPASSNADKNVLNSGIDLQFCVTRACKNKKAAYEVLDYLLKDENLQKYADMQNSIPCKEGNFKLASMLNGMKTYIANGKMEDFQDHYYPSEMAVDAQIQTFLIKKDTTVFLRKFDSDWKRYNEDIIAKIQTAKKNQKGKR